ncbi:MAG TPA: hypothetical protein V6D22_16155 [Candidatus Obscuribacterales bacterium]
MIRPQNPAKLLRAQAKVVQLQADEGETVLRGKVAEEAPRSSITTLEHGLHAMFHLDLKKLEANLAPDLERQMDAQIAAARRKIAGDVQREEHQMQRELAMQHPRPDMPAAPPQLSSDLSKTVTKSVERSKQMSHQESGAGEKRLLSELPPGGAPGAVMPRVGGGGGGAMIPVPLHAPHAPGIPSNSSAEVKDIEKQMQSELDSARNHVRNATPDLSRQIDTGTKLAGKTVTSAQPVMDAILTHLRKIPATSMPSPNTAVSAVLDSTKTIEWDAWHKQFAALARDPILRQVNKFHNPSGADTVEITVSADRHLAAKIVIAGPTKFDQAILQAYKSLDGNSGLAFPADSRRTSITFLIDNEHKGAGIPTGVDSQTSVGDKEVVHHQR